MRGKIDMYGLVALLVFVFVVIGIHELSAQEEAIVVEWGEEVSCPDLGFNARILRQHAEENCGQPEQEDFRYDWNSANLRQDVRDISPKVLRFPGGTPSNFWNWYNETRQVIGEDGNLHEIDVCEASFVGRTFSSSIGCEGDNLDITAERYSEIVTNTTVTVESYLNAIQYFRDQGMDVGELFVLNMIDPFYYLGSPHLEYITQGASPEVVKDTLRNNIVNKVEKQLDKILLEKCGSCESVDDEVSFELGNEFHLLRYGKYYPRMECFDMIDDSLCFNCFPDINFYADVCQDIIPLIRERFTNAKISVCASRNILQEPWNDVIIDRFAQDDELAIDAVVYHFYPKTFKKDSLNYARCVGNGNNYNSDKSLHYVQWHTDRLTFQKNLTAFDDTDLEMWITEFNSYDYSEKCNEAHPGWNEDDFVYDSANWLHTLNIFTIMDRFLTYRTDMYDPWTGNAQGLNIPKIAMHLFYGAEREAALNEDREMTAQGLGKSMLIDLVNNATSMQRLLVAPEENIDF
ncbi:MAG: hypothetical protein HKO93_01970, partial [Flavobacteriales bacterium]|nr:hypothetical protein [Flavobacteriales bacterium]